MNRLKKLIAAGRHFKARPGYTYAELEIAHRVGLPVVGDGRERYARLRRRRLIKLIKIMTTHPHGIEYSTHLRERAAVLSHISRY